MIIANGRKRGKNISLFQYRRMKEIRSGGDGKDKCEG